MHKIPVGKKVRVLVDSPCMARLMKGDVVMVAGQKYNGSYYVTDTDLVLCQPYWSVKEDQISPISPSMEENE